MFISVFISVFLKKAILTYDIPSLEVMSVFQGTILCIILPLMIKTRFQFFRKSALKLNLARNILYALSLYVFYSSLKFIPINVNIGVQFLAPVLSSILAILFLKEKNSSLAWVSLFVCIIGAFFIRGGFSKIEGNLELRAYFLLFLFIFFRSFGNILNRKLALKYDTMELIFYSHTIMFSLSFTFMLLLGDYKALPIGVFLSLCLAGFFYFIEYALIFRAFKHCSVLTIQPLEFSKMIYAIILSNIFLNEAPTIYQVFGSLIILSGFGLTILNKKNNKELSRKKI